MILFIHKVYGCLSEQCTSTLEETNKKPHKTQSQTITQPPKAFALVWTGVYIFQVFKHLHPIPW